MLHLMLLNECLLHYFSFMCVTLLVFSVCVNNIVHLYILVFSFSTFGKADQNHLLLVIGALNRFHHFNRLVN